MNYVLFMEEDLRQHFFVLQEKDGSHSAYIRFAGFENKEQAQYLIDTIIAELGMIKTETLKVTYH